MGGRSKLGLFGTADYPERVRGWIGLTRLRGLRMSPDLARPASIMSSETSSSEKGEPERGRAKGPGRFETTRWSLIFAASSEVDGQAADALNSLCRQYWVPVYAFVHRSGWAHADAEDLTQEFLAQLSAKRWIDKAEPESGRFRSFLLAHLRHFISNARRTAMAAKRGGGQVPLPFDTAVEALLPAADAQLEPAAAFDRSWALSLLKRAQERLIAEQTAGGKGEQLQACLPYLVNAPPPGAYAAIAEKLGVSRATVPVMVHRLNQRYRELIRAEVAETVGPEGQVDDELRHLLQAVTG